MPRLCACAQDVEGAEEIVLSTVNPGIFKVMLIESDGNATRDRGIEETLAHAGLRRYSTVISGPVNLGGHNHLFVRPERNCAPCAHGQRAKVRNETHQPWVRYFADDLCPECTRE